MPPTELPRVIFIHAMKTGGTSLQHMLVEQYGPELIFPVPVGNGVGRAGIPSTKGFPSLVQHHINPRAVAPYRVVMGHFDWNIVRRLPGWEVVTLVRHPVEQICSLYQYMVANDSLFPQAPAMRRDGIEKWVLGEGAVLLNNQTACFSGHRGDANLAIQNLRGASFGLLERFDESVERWNRRFGWNLQVQRRNVSQNPIEVTPPLRDFLTSLQAKDMRVYEEAKRMFEEAA